MGFLAAFSLLLACGAARAEETIFGIRMGDTKLATTQPDRRRDRALLSHWTPSIRDGVRIVEPGEPLEPLEHYSVRLAPDGRVCEIKAISDPLPASQSEELLKPMLFSLTHHFEEIYGTYVNYVDGQTNARLRLRDWAGLLARMEEAGTRYWPMAGWPRWKTPKSGGKPHERIALVRVAIYVDPDHKLRAAVEAESASHCRTSQ